MNTPPEKIMLPVTLLLALASFAYWLTSTANATSRNTQDIASILTTRRELLQEISELRADVAAVSAKLSVIQDYLIEAKKRNAR